MMSLKFDKRASSYNSERHTREYDRREESEREAENKVEPTVYRPEAVTLNKDELSKYFDGECIRNLYDLVDMLGSRFASTISVYTDGTVEIKGVNFPATMSTTVTDKSDYKNLRGCVNSFLDRFIGPTTDGEDVCELEIYVFSNPSPDEGTIPLAVKSGNNSVSSEEVVSPFNKVAAMMSGDRMEEPADTISTNAMVEKKVEHVDVSKIRYDYNVGIDMLVDWYRGRNANEMPMYTTMIMTLYQCIMETAIICANGEISTSRATLYEEYISENCKTVYNELHELADLNGRIIDNISDRKLQNDIFEFARTGMQRVMRFMQI